MEYWKKRIITESEIEILSLNLYRRIADPAADIIPDSRIAEFQARTESYILALEDAAEAMVPMIRSMISRGDAALVCRSLMFPQSKERF